MWKLKLHLYWLWFRVWIQSLFTTNKKKGENSPCKKDDQDDGFQQQGGHQDLPSF